MTETRSATHVPSGHESIDEVGELVVSLFAAPAHRATSLPGWTAHELVAHLAAGASEESELIESHLECRPERPTRGFEERELPFRALPDVLLRDRLVEEAARLTVALEALAADSARDGVLFTGRRMTAADFAMHSRSECALHRWDLVGRDDIGWAMLGQPELTTHALRVLTAMSSLPETPARRVAPFATSNHRAMIRSAPFDDVILTISNGVVALAQAPIDDSPPSVELGAAARLLLLWGRREPSAPVDVCPESAERPLVTALLGW
jgi:hypothetical protein